jgi:multidrug efflux pump subunit AcrA (membrane-fusion protein)
MVPLVAVVLIAILAFVHPGGGGARLVALDAGQMRSLGIVTAPLPTGEARLGRRLPARVVVPPAQIRVVAAPLAGMVEQVAVASQQSVRAGQLMARLTSPLLLEAQRDYLTAASELQLAESNSRRDEQLYREGIIGEARLRATQNSEAQAASAAQRRQVLRLYGMTPGAISALAKSRSLSPVIDLAAPITGVVLERMAEPG